MLYVWGSNASGQLGLAQRAARPARDASAERRRRSPSGGPESGFCAGAGCHVASPPTAARPEEPVPRLLASALGRRVCQVACGESHTLVLDETGTVLACGRNREGQLGLGHRDELEASELSTVEALGSERVAQVAAGSFHSLCVTSEGAALAWGLLHTATAPVRRAGPGAHLAGMEADSRTASRYARMLVQRSEQLYAGGEATGPARHVVRRMQTIPIEVPGLPRRAKVVQVAGGFSFTVLRTESGDMWGWGYNDCGQLGVGHRAHVTSATLMKLPAAAGRVAAFACGQQHTVVVDARGAVWAMGSNALGQLGQSLLPGHRRVHNACEALRVDVEATAVAVACGSFHSALLDAEGCLWTFGHSEYAQLGASAASTESEEHAMARGFNVGAATVEDRRSAPRRLPKPELSKGGLHGDGRYTAIACGALFTVAATAAGSLFTFGWGEGGALGHNENRPYRLGAKRVTALEGVAVDAVGAGGKHVVALGMGQHQHVLAPLRGGCAPGAEDSVVVLVGASRERFTLHRAVVESRCPTLLAIAAMAERWAPALLDMEEGGEGGEPTPRGVPRAVLPHVTAQVFAAIVDFLYFDRLDFKSWLTGGVARAARALNLRRLHLAAEARSRAAAEGQTLGALPPSSFVDDLRERGLKDMGGHDVWFRFPCGRMLSCHTAVLAAHSEYFDRLLRSPDFREAGAEGRTFDLGDVSPETFGLLLSWVYTGALCDCHEEPSAALELLAAADRFGFSYLLEVLDSALADAVLESELPREHVSWLAEHVERHNARRLTAACAHQLAPESPTAQHAAPSAVFAGG